MNKNYKPYVIALIILVAFSAASLLYKNSKINSDYKFKDCSKFHGGALFLACGKQNINKINKEELEAIPKIGHKLAQKIISKRNELGIISSWNQVKNIHGIGDKTIITLRKYLIIN